MKWIIIIVFLIIFGWYKYMTRIPANIGDVTEVTGGVKSGKTMCCVYWSSKQYKKNSVKFYKNLKKALKKGRRAPERPMYYSNMPVGDYSSELTQEHIQRAKRFNYGSIVYINEASIVNGSMDFKNPIINDRLLEFYKLIAHELGTHGKYSKAKGYLWIDTQAPEDCHYAVKRSVSSVLFIRKSVKFIGCHFIQIQVLHPNLNVYEQSQEDESTVAPWMSEKPHWYLIPHYPTFKLYDCYAYSSLTDDKDTKNVENPESLKIRKLLRAARSEVQNNEKDK